jgi:hypothetical protein
MDGHRAATARNPPTESGRVAAARSSSEGGSVEESPDSTGHGCWREPGRGDLPEQGNREQTADGRHRRRRRAQARVKRCGKSAPASGATPAAGNPHPVLLFRRLLDYHPENKTQIAMVKRSKGAPNLKKPVATSSRTRVPVSPESGRLPLASFLVTPITNGQVTTATIARPAHPLTWLNVVHYDIKIKCSGAMLCGPRSGKALNFSVDARDWSDIILTLSDEDDTVSVDVVVHWEVR